MELSAEMDSMRFVSSVRICCETTARFCSEEPIRADCTAESDKMDLEQVLIVSRRLDVLE